MAKYYIQNPHRIWISEIRHVVSTLHPEFSKSTGFGSRGETPETAELHTSFLDGMYQSSDDAIETWRHWHILQESRFEGSSEEHWERFGGDPLSGGIVEDFILVSPWVEHTSPNSERVLQAKVRKWGFWSLLTWKLCDHQRTTFIQMMFFHQFLNNFQVKGKYTVEQFDYLELKCVSLLEIPYPIYPRWPFTWKRCRKVTYPHGERIH